MKSEPIQDFRRLLSQHPHHPGASRSPEGQRAAASDSYSPAESTAPLPSLADFHALQAALTATQRKLQQVKVSGEASAAKATALTARLARVQEEFSEQTALLETCREDVRSANEKVSSAQGAIDTLHADLVKVTEERDTAMASREHQERESERFDYVLSDGSTGSVAMNLIKRSDCIWKRNYSGIFAVPRDADGRAFVSLNRQRFDQVIEHLTYGAIPPGPQPELMKLADYLALESLFKPLHIRQDGVKSVRAGDGFRATFDFVDVRNKLPATKTVVFGKRTFGIQVDTTGAYLIVGSSTDTFVKARVTYDLGLDLVDARRCCPMTDRTVYFTTKDDTWGRRWNHWGITLDEATSAPWAYDPGSLRVNLHVKSVTDIE